MLLSCYHNQWYTLQVCLLLSIKNMVSLEASLNDQIPLTSLFLLGSCEPF